MEEIQIKEGDEFIKLGQALKKAGMVVLRCGCQDGDLRMDW